MKPLAYLDYETKLIEARPDYPPEPVGIAIDEPGKRPHYYAWGHPTQNNCTKAEAAKAIKRVTRQCHCVYHNAKFDVEVSQKFFNLPLPAHDRYGCTMLLAYLRNPREINLKLKPLAERWLDQPADEQAELRDWILDNVKGARASPNKWGQWISLAPGKLVGKYAVSDIRMTKGLHSLFCAYITDKGMQGAYRVELQIVPIVIRMEQRGIHLDKQQLSRDLYTAEKNQKKAVNKVNKKLGKEVNLGSRPQVVEAFEAAGLVEPGAWIRNEPTEIMRDKGILEGHQRIGIEYLMQVCKDSNVNFNMALNSKLKKLLTTYMRPWLRQIEQHGKFYPWFNQTKGDNDYGTKSGRFCIAKGSLVSMPGNKLVRIEDIKVGDIVYSYTKSLTRVLRKVERAGKTGHRHVVRIFWVDPNYDPYRDPRLNLGFLDCTPEHRILLASRKYVVARGLKDGDVLATGKIVSGIVLQIYNFKSDVYDLTVSDTHNYIVNGVCVSNSSNFQQVPKKPDDSKLGLLLPTMRDYILPDTSRHTVLQRDFSQQELRILAYYEEGKLFDAFLDNPNLDVHEMIRQEIKKITGLALTRGVVKVVNFMLVYGGGANALSTNLKIPYREAQDILKAHKRALPGLKQLIKDVDNMVRRGNPIHTIAGREYFAEKGFEYRMLNSLIQGGGADHLKAAMIRVDDALTSGMEDARIVLTVHDELIISVPTRLKKQAMIVFKEAMDNDKLFSPMPMTSEGKAGKNWGACKKYEPKK